MADEVSASLTTLPPEVRNIIYAHLFRDLSITITRTGKIDTTSYPWQLSTTCRLLRDETLHLLRSPDSTAGLDFICEDAKFPDELKLQIPDYVYTAVSTVVVRGSLRNEGKQAPRNIQPSRLTFPNMTQLKLEVFNFYAVDYLTRLDRMIGVGDLSEAEWCFGVVYRTKICLEECARDMSSSRTGRAQYNMQRVIDGSLYDVLCMTRERRGFGISCRIGLQGGKRDKATDAVTIWFDWDAEYEEQRAFLRYERDWTPE
ncbi:hypothetical protein PMZ80_006779 [Knufia obscura]|uniref:F-box domain-containing protein n=2 Tax=Knufia TaxID=430999 RepID=A0AAN8E7Q7_9EURO|nr:hypothetical protein PMZ80_006779 [Knufia obscura]KAK5948099.1 hypothetical protein OHC33_010847 [Knufia fluminis]